MKPQVVKVAPKVQVASATADAAQVENAYEQVQAVYADQGAPGLARFSEGCADALAKDARVLDFCLAFDMFAAAIAPREGPDASWFATGEARRLRLAKAALPPNVDPQVRIDTVAQLMRQASGAPPIAAGSRAAAPGERVAPQHVAARPEAAEILKAAGADAAAPPSPRDPCTAEATPNERLVCADPGLKSADQRMRRALAAARASGADPARLDREQADWLRSRDDAAGARAMADLYARRIDELEKAGQGAAPRN